MVMLTPIAVAMVIILSIVLSVRLFRTVTLRRERQRRAPAPSTRTLPIVSTPSLPESASTPAPASVVESVSLALPVHGLLPARDRVVALERALRRLAGVTAAYVSPITALAYLDYLPAQVTEEQLVQAIGREGYRVGDVSRRFDWRRVQKS